MRGRGCGRGLWGRGIWALGLLLSSMCLEMGLVSEMGWGEGSVRSGRPFWIGSGLDWRLDRFDEVLSCELCIVYCGVFDGW